MESVSLVKATARHAIKRIGMNVRVVEGDLLWRELNAKKFVAKIVSHAVKVMYIRNVPMSLL